MRLAARSPCAATAEAGDREAGLHTSREDLEHRHDDRCVLMLVVAATAVAPRPALDAGANARHPQQLDCALLSAATNSNYTAARSRAPFRRVEFRIPGPAVGGNGEAPISARAQGRVLTSARHDVPNVPAAGRGSECRYLSALALAISPSSLAEDERVLRRALGRARLPTKPV